MQQTEQKKINTEINCTENFDILLHEFIDNVTEALKPLLKALDNMANSLQTAFLEAWKEVKYDLSFFDKNISRKKFVKLLMSIGYQRNAANSIAWKYHKEKGKYTILDFMVESRKREDLLK